MNAVETVRLEKRYGNVRALKELSIAVPAGTLALVSGSNGAGKTTLLRVLACLTRPTRGTVRLFSRDPYGARAADLRSRIGFLGAEAGLYGELSVAENLAFVARLHGIGPERLDAVVSEFQLGDVAHRRVRTLSFGYRRRAGLARALLNRPDLLLLDEPWNGLDAEAAERLSKRLARLRDDGATALVAAHRVGEWRGLFDLVVRLEAGRLVGFDAPEAKS